MKRKNKVKRTQNGSLLLEVIIALTVLAVIATSLLNLLPKIAEDTRNLRIQGQISTLSDYVGNYVTRWSNFSPLAKAQALNSYSEGDELELTGERRINRLLWADPLLSTENMVSDEFKVSMTFHETASRSNSAIIKITIWYDEDLDNAIDSSERTFIFSTVVSEKETL